MNIVKNGVGIHILLKNIGDIIEEMSVEDKDKREMIDAEKINFIYVQNGSPIKKDIMKIKKKGVLVLGNFDN